MAWVDPRERTNGSQERPSCCTPPGAIAAVCPPLDLAEAARALDAPERALYRRHIFAGLDAAARRLLPVPPSEVRRARSLRERDEITIIPASASPAPATTMRARAP